MLEGTNVCPRCGKGLEIKTIKGTHRRNPVGTPYLVISNWVHSAFAYVGTPGGISFGELAVDARNSSFSSVGDHYQQYHPNVTASTTSNGPETLTFPLALEDLIGQLSKMKVKVEQGYWMAEEAEGVNIMLLGVRRTMKDQEPRRLYGKYPDGGMARKRTEHSLESTLASSHAHRELLVSRARDSVDHGTTPPIKRRHRKSIGVFGMWRELPLCTVLAPYITVGEGLFNTISARISTDRRALELPGDDHLALLVLGQGQHIWQIEM
ncbi:hypothetical protein PILCRDRAFT_92804 [Piloderma croceum F 1598]|uniref:Uncharacterized protein n=1 Tax=Piloderma croceum (strain F 1598) TaxID=765440 RepID=A0A0C3F1X2_PILCF|nr:hypothetical protein PILCRDRAFT_92804 [Piloderma croceum F 1598]